MSFPTRLCAAPARARRRQLLERAAVLLLGAAMPAAASALPASVRSADGRFLLQASADGVIVQQLDGTLQRTYRARSLDGREQGRPSALLALPARRSFVIAFDALPELWEIPLAPDAEPIFDGYVHDYRMGEAIARPGFLGVRRTRLQQPLLALAGDGAAYVLGRAADRHTAAGPRAHLVLVQLDVRRALADFELDADPDLGAALARQDEGRLVLVVPERRGGPPWRVDLRAARLLPRGAP